MGSIFTKIISGEIPCYKVAETTDFIAFLDINPNTAGHTICIPKIEIDKIFDLNDDLYIGLMAFSKKVAIALEKTISCKRVGMAVIGLEVPHAHVHLIPINHIEDMAFQKKVALSNIEFETLAAQISKNIID